MATYSSPPSESDETAVASIRNDWLLKQIRAQRSSFERRVAARLFAGTYNCAGKKPTDEDVARLGEWLLPLPPTEEVGGDALATDLLPDLYAVGFQEIVDLNAVGCVGRFRQTARSAQTRSFGSVDLSHSFPVLTPGQCALRREVGAALLDVVLVHPCRSQQPRALRPRLIRSLRGAPLA